MNNPTNDKVPLIELYLKAIDSKNINEIEKLIKENNGINNNNRDVVFELYNKRLLSCERFQFIVEKCTGYLNLSSVLMKKLIKDSNFELLDIAFNYINVFDNELVINLLLYYKNKKAISHSDLNKQISNKKYIISKDDNETYLSTACIHGNENIIKYLVEIGTNINEKKGNGETPLFDACKRGNKAIVKYLVERGADINEENILNETSLFNACEKGNEAIIKYLVEYVIDINKENRIGRTPFFFFLHVKVEMSL